MPLPAAKKISTKIKTPEQARAAKEASPDKPQPPKFDAPADFRPHFVEVKFTVGKDGLIDPTTFAASRVKGRWETKENPRYDMATYDAKTMLGIACRLSSISFAPNIQRRLPVGNRYLVIIRVAKKAADDTLVAGVKIIARALPAGKMSWVKDAADPDRRRIRRATRLLASAFIDSQLPPKRVRAGKED